MSYNNNSARNRNDIDLFTTVDDELFGELADLAGQRIVHVSIWEESLADELAGMTDDEDEESDTIDDDEEDNLRALFNGLGSEPGGDESEDDEPPQEVFDLDLYLADGVYFELYGTVCFPDLDADPLQGSETANKLMASLINQGIWFDEVAVDEEEQLVLVISQQRLPVLYLVVGGWLIEEWDELPTA